MVEAEIRDSTLCVMPDKPRDQSIDILRGLAIFTMVAANAAGNILEEPHPFLFRFYGTFAAPMFIFLSGMMIAQSKQKVNRGSIYYLIRGGLIVLMGMLIDILIWGHFPLVTFDVLYLIGFATPIAYYVSRMPKSARLAVALLIFALTPLLQPVFGYQRILKELPIAQVASIQLIPHLSEIGRHFFIDGWFPLFPWLGFALLGVALFPARQKTDPQKWLFSALIISVGGAIFWFLNSGPLYTRDGYSELFYPPSWGYITTTIGLILLALSVVPKLNVPWLSQILGNLGRCSLFIYTLHCLLIQYILNVFWPQVNFPEFAFIYVGFIGCLSLIALWVNRLKTAYPPKSFLLSFLLGG